MNLHSSVHLDFARERRLNSIARAERHNLEHASEARLPKLRRRFQLFGRSVGEPGCEAGSPEAPATTLEPGSRATFRELAHRVDGGIDVALLWSALENRLAVTVFDERAGELLVLDAESDKALDVFYHPYAHAESKAAA